MSFRNPGKLFIEQYGAPESIDDVIRYVEFLRQSAGLDHRPPIFFDSIYETYNIPQIKRTPLDDVSGLLIPHRGQILVNLDDPVSRQRFSEAHELMEMLFSAISDGPGWATRRIGVFKKEVKERLCNQGAAELLMPQESFNNRIVELGVSMGTARMLSLEYQVSFQAALYRMAIIAPGRHSAVQLGLREHTPHKNSALNNALQPALFPSEKKYGMQRRFLVVEQSFNSPSAPRILIGLVIPTDSNYYRLYNEGGLGEQQGVLELGNLSGIGRWEARTIETASGRKILSLLHFPRDNFCGL